MIYGRCASIDDWKEEVRLGVICDKEACFGASD